MCFTLPFCFQTSGRSLHILKNTFKTINTSSQIILKRCTIRFPDLFIYIFLLNILRNERSYVTNIQNFLINADNSSHRSLYFDLIQKLGYLNTLLQFVAYLKHLSNLKCYQRCTKYKRGLYTMKWRVHTWIHLSWISNRYICLVN